MTEQCVCRYCKNNGTVVKVWKSQRDVWRTLNVQQSMISQALNGKCKTAYGYEWEYGNIHEQAEQKDNK